MRKGKRVKNMTKIFALSLRLPVGESEELPKAASVCKFWTVSECGLWVTPESRPVRVAKSAAFVVAERCAELRAGSPVALVDPSPPIPVRPCTPKGLNWEKKPLWLAGCCCCSWCCKIWRKHSKISIIARTWVKCKEKNLKMPRKTYRRVILLLHRTDCRAAQRAEQRCGIAHHLALPLLILILWRVCKFHHNWRGASLNATNYKKSILIFTLWGKKLFKRNNRTQEKCVFF